MSFAFSRLDRAPWEIGRAGMLSLLVMLAACGGADSEPAFEVAQGTGQLRALAAGTAAADVHPAGSAVVRIRAAGSLAASTGAMASVRFNGVPVAAGELTHGELVDYLLEVPGAAAGGTLDIVLANATTADGQPLRSLRVEALSLADTTLRPADPGVVFDAGAGEAAFDNQGLSAGQALLTRNGALRFTLPAAASPAATAAAGGSAVYVDAQRGDDNHPGTAERPWRSFSRLQPGLLPTPRHVFLRCDSVWRSSIVLAAPQLQDGTTFAGYGPECATRKATISGADLFVGNWQKSGSTWTRALPPGTPKITQLFIDGQALRTAQWPNAGTVSSQTLTSAAGGSASKTLQLRSTEQGQLAGRDLAGATIQMRTQSWLIETAKVQSASPGRIELESAPAWTMAPGKAFVLQDKPWMLDSPGEFFHDTSTQRLHVLVPDALAAADLNTLAVEGSVRNVALSLNGRRYLNVRGLALQGTTQTGLALENTSQATVQGVEASHNGVNGIRLGHWPREAAGTPGSVISDNLLRGNGRFGIDAIESQRTQLLRNRVTGTGVSFQHQAGVVAGIASGPGGVTEDNLIEDSGYLGISFSSLGASRVTGNTVTGICQRLLDCGGIYTWTGRENGPLANGALVERNRVVASHDTFSTGNKLDVEIVVGVYIDDHSHGVTVRDNLLAHTPMGVFVHNASRTRVTGNRIWLPTETGLWASMDDAEGDSMTGNVFDGNEIVPAMQAQATAGQLPRFGVAQAVWFWHTQSAEAALSATRNLFSGNTVTQLFGPLASHAWLRGPQGDWRVDTAAWLALNAAESRPAATARFDVLIPLLGEEKIANGQFEHGTNAWIEYRDPGSTGGATRWLPAQTGCTAACVGFAAGHRGDLLASQPFSMKAGAPHLYRWSATMPAHAGATVGAPYISRAGTPWDMMTDAQGYVGITPRSAGAGESLQYEAYFTAKSSDASRVNLGMDTLGTRVTFDEVSVREVLGYSIANRRELAAIATAPRDRGMDVDCAGLGWPAGCSATDLQGQPVALPLMLPAGAERLLLRKDSSFRR